MAKSTTLAIPQTTVQIAQTIVTATGFIAANAGTAPTNTVLVATAGSNDSIIKALSVAMDDTTARTMQLWLSKDSGTTKYLIGSAYVSASAGMSTVAHVDVLNNAYMAGAEIDETGKPIIRLAAGSTLYAGITTAAMSASTTMWITGTQLDY